MSCLAHSIMIEQTPFISVSLTDSNIFPVSTKSNIKGFNDLGKNCIHLDEFCEETDIDKASTSKHFCTQKNNDANILLTASRKYRQGSSQIAVGCLKEMSDFEILESLGEGFFGMVRERQSLNTEIVMKVPIIHNHSCRLSAKKIVTKEDYMLRLLNHSNILKSRGICVQRNNFQWQLNLLVDFCDAGSLQQLILNHNKPFPWHQRCLIAIDVCKAMSYVHSQGFMHRDLTSMNILLQTQKNLFPKAVVADFGLSSKIPKYPKIFQQVGTQNWMAPEMLKEQFYNEKADVFSFGVIMCQMIARIDADHDAGLYRTPMFGLDYVRFTAGCPSETPLSLLKIAFMSCLWNSESRPSFDVLSNNLQEVLFQNTHSWNSFPRESFKSIEETRLGRSHSDAAIRGINLGDTLLANSENLLKVPGKTFKILPRKCGEHTPKKKLNNARNLSNQKKLADFNLSLVIPEGCVVENLDSIAITESTKNKNSFLCKTSQARIKELAATAADEDPNYQESKINPFSEHIRYRSIRKMKPRDLEVINRCGISSDCTLSATKSVSLITPDYIFAPVDLLAIEDSDSSVSVSEQDKNTEDVILKNQSLVESRLNVSKKCIKFRSHSLPSSFAFCIRHESKESKLYSSEKIYADKFSFSNPLKKNSLTLGQRNLPLSFRDYDHQFTSGCFVRNNGSSNIFQKIDNPPVLKALTPSTTILADNKFDQNSNSIIKRCLKF